MEGFRNVFGPDLASPWGARGKLQFRVKNDQEMLRGGRKSKFC